MLHSTTVSVGMQQLGGICELRAAVQAQPWLKGAAIFVPHAHLGRYCGHWDPPPSVYLGQRPSLTPQASPLNRRSSRACPPLPLLLPQLPAPARRACHSLSDRPPPLPS